MCYSALVDRELRKAEKEYEATINDESFRDLYCMRELDTSIKIPDGMEQSFIEHGGSTGKLIKQSVDRYRRAEQIALNDEAQVLRQEIEALESTIALKPTKTAQNKLGVLNRKLTKINNKIESPNSTGDYRIYPYYFAPVIIQNDRRREIVPMRYRILPRTGVEVPNQYNVFNARRDSLTTAKNWKPLFGKKHAIFPFIRFFEWVEREGKKVELSFSPDYESMWAACLYEEYQHPELGLIRSFAMVTDEPPKEIAQTGHDRCPVFLREDLISDWLTPKKKTLEELVALLSEKQPAYYSHAMAA